MKSKTLKYTVSVAILSTLIQATPTFASPVTQSQIKATQGQIAQTKGQIDATKGQISDFETKMMQLDNQISNEMIKGQQLSNTIQAQQGQIKNTKIGVQKAQNDLNSHKKVYANRLRNYQYQGQSPFITYVEVLLSSKNLSEFLTRSTAITEILQSDDNIMSQLNEKQQALQNEEQKLHSELDNLQKSQDKLASDQKQMEANKQKVEQALASSQNTLQQQQAQQAGQQATLQTQQTQLTQQQQAERIRQAQIVAQQEAENARKAQSVRQAPQVQQSSSDSNTSSSSTHITSAPSVNASSASAVISYAEQFLGVPYVWGGTDPSGFDCSGLMQYVFAHAAGIQLPRVAEDQQNVGTEISPYDVQAGDLVFMGRPAYHVGLYIGGGRWLEAPETGDVVKIVNYNPAHFTSAARILR